MEHSDKIFYRHLTEPINDLFNKISNISILNKNSNSIPSAELKPVIEEINLGFNKLDTN